MESEQEEEVGGEEEESLSPGTKLRAARMRAKLKITEMAERTGYNMGYLSKIENDLAKINAGIIHAYEEVTGESLDIIPTGKIPPFKPKTFKPDPYLEERKALLHEAEDTVYALAAGKALEPTHYIRLGMFFREMENMLKERKEG